MLLGVITAVVCFLLQFAATTLTLALQAKKLGKHTKKAVDNAKARKNGEKKESELKKKLRGDFKTNAKELGKKALDTAIEVTTRAAIATLRLISTVVGFIGSMLAPMAFVFDIAAVFMLVCVVAVAGYFSLGGNLNLGGGNRAPAVQQTEQQTRPSGTHSHIAWNQGMFDDCILGSNGKKTWTIASSGCGFCSWCAIMNKLAIQTEWSPREWLNWFNNVSTTFSNTSDYWYGNGMPGGFPVDAAKAVTADMDGVSVEVSASITPYDVLSNDEVYKFIQANLADDTCIMLSTGISAKGVCVFTNGAHIIAVMDYADASKDYVHIADSSSLSASYAGSTWDEFNKYCTYSWPINPSTVETLDKFTLTNTDAYKIKAMWAIRRTQ